MTYKSRTVSLDKVPTRVLMRARIYGKCWSECECEFCSDRGQYFHRFGSDHDGTNVGFFASQDNIRAELANREHVQSKREGSSNRRKKSSRRHGRAKGKDR